MSEFTSICVRYTYIDGWHVFKSDDLPGLYIANKEAEKSFNDVANAIEKLIFLDEGIKCQVQAEMTFEEFIDVVKDSAREIAHASKPVKMSDKRYLVYPLAA